MNKYYVGETEDVERRIIEHNTGKYKTSYTRIANDWELKLSINFITRKKAREAELFIKKMNSKIFIEKLLNDNEWFRDRFK